MAPVFPADSSRQPRVLGLFAKRPVPGSVKTRLAEASTPDLAAQIADAFLLDAIERFAAIDARRVLVFSPPDAQSFFDTLVNGRFELTAQSEGDLGQRMGSFFSEQFREGGRFVVLLGTDSPTLPVALVEQAFAELEEADLVLGPATDGGYYLIGCSRPLPFLFENVAWSSSRVLVETVQRLPASGCRLGLLPPWYDVDTLDDWRMLQGHVAALRRAGQDPGIPHTERLLQGQMR